MRHSWKEAWKRQQKWLPLEEMRADRYRKRASKRVNECRWYITTESNNARRTRQHCCVPHAFYFAAIRSLSTPHHFQQCRSFAQMDFSFVGDVVARTHISHWNRLHFLLGTVGTIASMSKSIRDFFESIVAMYEYEQMSIRPLLLDSYRWLWFFVVFFSLQTFFILT